MSRRVRLDELRAKESTLSTLSDRGEGGNYLFLPPGWEGDVPDDHFTFRSSTFGNVMFWRGFLVDGKPGYMGPWITFTKPQWSAWGRLADHLRDRLQVLDGTAVLGLARRNFVNLTRLPAAFLPALLMPIVQSIAFSVLLVVEKSAAASKLPRPSSMTKLNASGPLYSASGTSLVLSPSGKLG